MHDTQYLRVLMGRLRQKIEGEVSEPKLIVNEPGIGYRIAWPQARSRIDPCGGRFQRSNRDVRRRPPAIVRVGLKSRNCKLNLGEFGEQTIAQR
jgi:hypothetical protein